MEHRRWWQVERDWRKINYIHFALLALFMVGVGFIDGDIYDRPIPATLFVISSIYMMIGSAVLLSQTGRIEKRLLVHAVAWSMISAGAVFFIFADAVTWFIFVPVGLGSIASAFRAWKGMDDYV